jgi:glycosyltransferase involved in cell wall biosynthesis
VVTPSFNQGPFVERTIRSVLDQQGDFDLDYLVVDGQSTDATLSILRKYEDRLTWISEPDRGQVDAINKGFQRVRGDIVGWLNSDDVLLPGALARVVDAFTRHPHVDWVHGRCEIIDADDRVIRRWISAYKHWCCRWYSYGQLVTENFISQMTVFWRRPVLDQIGLLDTGLKLAFDYDLWLRLAKRGAPVYLPEPIACFRWYDTSKSGSSFDRQFREDYEVATRHEPDRRWLHLIKRFKTARILVAYKIMSFLRAAFRNKARSRSAPDQTEHSARISRPLA